MGILNAIFAVAVCFASRTFYYVIVAVLVHLLLVWMTKRDPQWRNVYIAYNRHGDRYDPGVRARVSARGQRPYGFGRSWPC